MRDARGLRKSSRDASGERAGDESGGSPQAAPGSCVHDSGKPESAQPMGCHRAACAGRAAHDHGSVAIQVAGALANLRQRNVDAAREVTRYEFLRTSHIDDLCAFLQQGGESSANQDRVDQAPGEIGNDDADENLVASHRVSSSPG